MPNIIAKFCCVCGVELDEPREVDNLFSELVTCPACDPYPPPKPAHSDPAQTANNPELLSRFYVSLTAPEYDRHKGVGMMVSRSGALSEDDYRRLLSPLSSDDGYLCSVIDDTFSASEVEFLREFFAAVEPSWTFENRPVTPIEQNRCGITAIPIGGSRDMIRWRDASGALGPRELPICVTYDLAHPESGPYAERAWLESPAEIDTAGIPF